MTRFFLLAAAGFLLAGCTTPDGQPFVRIEPVTADDPPAQVHMSAPAMAADREPQSF